MLSARASSICAFRQLFARVCGGLILVTLIVPADTLVAATLLGGPGSIDEFPTPSNSSTTIGMASDGSIWYTASFPTTVGHLMPSGEVIEYPIPTTADNLNSILVGPDHNIWFGEWSNPGGVEPLDRIGRISPDGGNFQEFVVPPSIHGPTYSHFPHSLMIGPDGNIWLAVGEDAIGQVTIDGTISLFYLPPDPPCWFFGQQPYGIPSGLTIGPDGALWISTVVEGLARFDLVSLQFQTVSLEACGTWPSAEHVVTGPDGNLWVTGLGTNTVYRVTLNGQIARFRLPGLPSGIVSSGGSIFVTRLDHQFNEVSRIDPLTGNVLNDYPIPTLASSPEDLVVDPAGNLWFNEQDGHNIARLHNPSPCVDALRLTYAAGVLNLNFVLTNEAPAIWITWLGFDSTLVPLWGTGLPAVSPAVFFDAPIPSFPSLGNVAVLTVLITSTGHICGDFQTVDTGGVGATAQALQQLLASKVSGRLPF